MLGSPLFLVKTHLQTSSSQSIAVGYQHRHPGTWAGLRHLYAAGGLVGLWQGGTASVPRICVGSAAQLVTYRYRDWYISRNIITKILLYCSYVSDALAANTSLKAESWQANLCGAVLSGFVVAVVINPLDVVTTRLYNQPAQVLGYSSNEAMADLSNSTL